MFWQPDSERKRELNTVHQQTKHLFKSACSYSASTVAVGPRHSGDGEKSAHRSVKYVCERESKGGV